ncbi:TonB-dependent receptor [Sphingobacterium sp. lm-10]|uniref:SusC/RagA family TonB-linked outer membrane protein n=1 Tax=Sphingobacterium sp. lm-10 TaxID=2944904 RepID=UPI002021570E|nr:TonB-dependent receptor [Sphingobacterium sp. lm-10]MCL7986705.1 TonB-dependent receptor [Sphingobacterium sp. lm-10]
MKDLKILLCCLFLCCANSLFAQQRTIRGTVVKEDNTPLQGVSVSAEKTTDGATTDKDGQFELRTDGTTLIVSFIGYKTQKIEIGSRSSFNITLEDDDQTIDDVVVVGYGTQSRRNLTGAVSDINAKEIVRTSSTTTAGALAGKIQGISVRAQDGRPGRGAALEIRNMGSPLFVIDGIPYGGQTGNDWVGSSNVSGQDAFNALNIEDIENITILKDASAAIYGLRAANGVVLVTTKKGSKGESVRVNINGYMGWQNLTRFPTLANAAQYTRALVETAQNEGGNPSAVMTREELAKWQAGTEAGYQGYNYYDMIVRKNIPQNYINANINGSSANSNYFLSVGNLNQDAMMEDFSYKRTNLQANLETTILKGLTVGTQISGRQEYSQDVGLPGGDGYFASFLALFRNRPTVGPYANDNPLYPNHVNDFAYNPAIFSRDIAGYKDNRYRNANVNLFAQYKTDFGLSAKGTVSYNYTNNKFDGFQYSYDVFTYDRANDAYNRTHGTDSRWRYQTEREVVARYAQFQLDYTKDFGDHHLSTTLGYERSDWDRNYQAVGSNPTNNYIPLQQLDQLNSFGDGWDYEARAGYIGRINYNYKGKYLLEVLGRYDGSYLYYEDNRWGIFPGMSAGWRVSDEAFFESLKGTINDLKFRFSVGQTGLEQGVAMHGYLAGYNWNQGNAILDGAYVPGLQPRGLPIRNLSWVKNTNYNIGMDLAMFDNKLTFTADAFKIIRSGTPAQRYDVLLPSEIGYGLPPENLGKNGYYGIEGMLTYSSNVGEFGYVVSGNVTYSRYRSIETYKPRFGSAWNEYRNSIEDRWGGVWWGYQVEGRFESEEQIRNHPINNDGQNNRTQLPGDFIYKDVNGDGVINGLDERPIGYPTGWAPMLSFGGRIGLNYKGFDLNLDFAGGAIQSWNQDYELRNALHGGGNSPAYLLEDRWHRVDPYDLNSEWIPGYYPAIRNGNSGPNHRNSDFWLTNVRYLRVRNMELGYTFAQGLASKIGSSKIRVYVNGSNLFSFDNVKRFQIDPEISAPAAVVYPQQKVIMAGFNITF